MKTDETDQYHVYWAGLTPDGDGKYPITQLTFGPYEYYGFRLEKPAEAAS